MTDVARLVEESRTVMELYAELTREAVDARERAARLGALSIALRELGERSASRVARRWANRMERLAEDLDGLRAFIERAAGGEEEACA